MFPPKLGETSPASHETPSRRAPGYSFPTPQSGRSLEWRSVVSTACACAVSLDGGFSPVVAALFSGGGAVERRTSTLKVQFGERCASERRIAVQISDSRRGSYMSGASTTYSSNGHFSPISIVFAFIYQFINSERNRCRNLPHLTLMGLSARGRMNEPPPCPNLSRTRCDNIDADETRRQIFRHRASRLYGRTPSPPLTRRRIYTAASSLSSGSSSSSTSRKTFRNSVLGKRRWKEGKQMNLRRHLLRFHPPALRNAPKSPV
ncbi:hypothetical protein KSP40_PGU021608 [Platanthera guangdongensis]|uniref:Uncharacterized protein n=1 Tax=Platanthera guangdongensis TaxID=2320717 RepID=A0ABR2M8C1_9ASPA